MFEYRVANILRLGWCLTGAFTMERNNIFAYSREEYNHEMIDDWITNALCSSRKISYIAEHQINTQNFLLFLNRVWKHTRWRQRCLGQL